MKLLGVILLAFGLAFAGAGAELEIRNTVRDTEGEPLAGILVHSRPQEGNGAAAQTTRTDAQGRFSFTLPDGAWFIEVDPAELLERGYFCVPGWNPGDFPELPLIAVPITPELSYSLSRGVVTLEATFDWLPGLEPSVMRMCAVQRSEDLVNWETFAIVGLTNPPIKVEDPNVGVEACFYRTVDMGVSLVVINRAPE